MNNQIEELTPEQEVALEAMFQDWLAYGRSTASLDIEEIRQAAADVYALINEPAPEIVLCSSPEDLLAKGRIFQKENDPTASPDELSDLRSVFKAGMGQYWLAFYDFPRKHIPDFAYDAETDDQLTKWIRLTRCCGFYLPFQGTFFVAERPVQLHVDEQGRLHNTNGPAISYSDGFSIYSVHGVRLPNGEIVENKAGITAEKIAAERNVEIRRIMIDFMGMERFITESGAIKMHEDDFGILYRKDVENDEPVLTVKVVNATAEADGSFKDYFIRVAPTCKTAKEAVAWTFNVPTEKYAPLVET